MISLPKKRKRSIMEPRLIAMIDVFSILTIFLIAGTVTDVSSIVLPGGLTLPFGTKPGSLMPATQINLSHGWVSIAGEKESYPFEAFRNDGDRSLAPLRLRLKDEAARRRAKDQNADLAIYVVADQSVVYRDLFDVMRGFRAEGFESLILISEAKGSKQ